MRTTRARLAVLLTVFAVGAAACGASGTSSSAKSSSGAVAAPAAARGALSTSGAGAGSSAAGGTGQAQTGRAQTIGAAVTPATPDIVENGTLHVRLRNAAGLRRAYGAITDLAVAAGGFVANSTLENGKVPSASITVRVPNPDVTAVLARIGGMGTVAGRTLSGQDVTGQVDDLSVEITNLTSEEAAVRHLLADAGSVKDILTVQQQLFSLQDEIQQLTMQSNLLHNQVQYATVAVSLTTAAVAAAPVHHHHPTTAARFWDLARSHTVGTLRGVFLAVGWSAPGLALLVVVGGAVLVLRRRRSTTARPVGPDA